MILVLLLFVSLLACEYLFVRKRPKNYPPGPLGLPIVGNLWQVQSNPFETYASLRRKYGNIFSVDLGSLRAVVLNDYKSVKEAYARSEFAGRPKASMSVDDKGIHRGFAFTEGKVWTEQRRFILKNLRYFGFGVKSIDSRLQEEALETIIELKSKVGVPINMYEQFAGAAINSIWEIAAGERFEKSNPEFIRICHLVSKIFKDSDTFFTAMMFPWLKNLRADKQRSYAKNFSEIYNALRQRISQHKDTYSDDFQRDLIDCYLKQMKGTTDRESSFYKETGDANMVFSIADMVFNGVETIGVALTWISLTMAHFPEIQEKLFTEIKEVVGLETLPSLRHQNKMPYTQAVIMEVMRYSRFVPLIFHKTIENVEISGFTIPKNTAVFANFHEILWDPNVWGDPTNFRPERFISEDGKDIIKPEAFMPFSFGKRVCPGETYAKDQLFIFVANLFQNFIINFDPNNEMPTFESDPGALTRYPKHHKLVLQNRL